MRGDSRALSSAERTALEAAIVAETTPDYVVVRALIALGEETPDRLARVTAMGREFVTGARRYVHAGRAVELLRKRPSSTERLMEAATERLIATGGREISIADVAGAVGIARRSLHRRYSSRTLIDACRRRALTIWRSRFVRHIRNTCDDPVDRLFCVVDVLAAWTASERFRVDLTLWPTLSGDASGDDLREHLDAVARFGTQLAEEAVVANARAFGAFVATNVAGAAAWRDRPDEAYAAAVAFVACLTGSPRLR
jgi:AcrR family transcriptional regulator